MDVYSAASARFVARVVVFYMGYEHTPFVFHAVSWVFIIINIFYVLYLAAFYKKRRTVLVYENNDVQAI